MNLRHIEYGDYFARRIRIFYVKGMVLIYSRVVQHLQRKRHVGYLLSNNVLKYWTWKENNKLQMCAFSIVQILACKWVREAGQEDWKECGESSRAKPRTRNQLWGVRETPVLPYKPRIPHMRCTCRVIHIHSSPFIVPIIYLQDCVQQFGHALFLIPYLAPRSC